jgi:hypothetical protein
LLTAASETNEKRYFDPEASSSTGITVKYHADMAVVGASRTSRHGGVGGFHGSSSAAGVAHHAILAAAQPYYPHHASSLHSHSHIQQPPSPAAANTAPSTPLQAQDIQPDRPIGYGAFGVVW